MKGCIFGAISLVCHLNLYAWPTGGVLRRASDNMLLQSGCVDFVLWKARSTQSSTVYGVSHKSDYVPLMLIYDLAYSGLFVRGEQAKRKVKSFFDKTGKSACKTLVAM